MFGERVGSYWIESQLGEGGMGAVYLARHTLIGRQAAIKVLLPELSNRPDIVKRFFNEARATTAIKHPGIVEIYDFGHHENGSAFIVMEYLEGESLTDRIRGLGVIEPTAALDIMKKVASALGAAHAQGIVHRDLKPDNIFLVPDPDIAGGERIKILDFGIAKLAEESVPSALKTRTGTIMGTPAYMAPEQCRGAGHVDHRADIYALGCILFEMMCGRRPFIGQGTGEVLGAQLHVPPPQPRSLNPSLSLQHEQLLLRMLAKDPDHRPQTASALIAEIGDHGDAATSPVALPHQVTLQPSPPSDTTLSAAAAASHVREPSSTQRHWLPIAVTSMLIAAGGLLALALGGKGGDDSSAHNTAGDEQETPSEDALPKQAPKPAPPPAPAPLPMVEPRRAAKVAPKPEKVKLTIDSRPPGALVYSKLDARKLGSTPYVHTFDPGPGTLEFVIKARGRKEVRLAWPANRGGTKTVRLQRAAKRPRAPPEAPQTTPPPTPKNPEVPY